MPTDSIILISAALVVAGVVAKVATTNFIGRQKRELVELENRSRKLQAQLEALLEQRQAAEENLEFYERRKEEANQERPPLEQELERLLDSERKHLEALGYDPDEEGVAAFVPHADMEAGATAATGTVDARRDEPRSIAVLPADLGNADKLFLPDAVVSELLGMGAEVLERSLLSQKLQEQGEQLADIIEREEYFRLGSVGALKAVVVVNTLMQGAGVASATFRVVEIPSGSIILSSTYEQPGTHERSPDFHKLTQTARVVAESIHGALRPQADPADVAPEVS